MISHEEFFASLPLVARKTEFATELHFEMRKERNVGTQQTGDILKCEKSEIS